MKHYVLPGLAALLLSFHVQAMDIEEGLWEIHLQAMVPGMASQMMPAQSIRQCITQKTPVPQGDMSMQGCDINNTISGNTVSWTVSCAKKGLQLSGSGRATYSGTALNGESVIDMQGMPMSIRTRITGKRVGDC